MPHVPDRVHTHSLNNHGDIVYVTLAQYIVVQSLLFPPVILGFIISYFNYRSRKRHAATTGKDANTTIQ